MSAEKIIKTTKEAKVFCEYLGDNGELCCLKNDAKHQCIAEKLTHCVLYQFEAPDLFIRDNDDNTIIIIEHFAFDGSKANRKGSKNQQELARIQRAADEELVRNQACYHFDAIDCEYCYEDYVKNALSGFKDHYGKIAKYKENLESEDVIPSGAKIQVFFLIEDVSPLPLYYKTESGAQSQVTLAYSRDFLNALEVCTDLDGVIFCQRRSGVDKCAWIILRESIPEYHKEALDYNDSMITSFKPNTISFNISNLPIKV